MIDFEEKEFSFDREIERTTFEKVWSRLLEDSSKLTELIDDKEDLIKINKFEAVENCFCHVGHISIDIMFSNTSLWKEIGDLIVITRELMNVTYEKISDEKDRNIVSIILIMPQLLMDCIHQKCSKEEFDDTKKSFMKFLDWISDFQKRHKCLVSFKPSSNSFVQVKWLHENISHNEFLTNKSQQIICRDSKYDLSETIGYTELKDYKKIIEYSFDKIENYGF